MCRLCDDPQATRHDFLRGLRKKVLKSGWAPVYVEDGRWSFAYTVGLHLRGFAEYLVTGMTPAHALQLLDIVVDYTLHEVQPKPGDTMTIDGGPGVEFVEVDQPNTHLAFAANLYGPDVRALQLAWRDERGHSPWCPDFDGGRGSQPVLGKRGPRVA
jgi:hypothetical protein